jgi:hypothetical protein
MAAENLLQVFRALQLVFVKRDQVLFADLVFDFGHKIQAAKDCG